MKTTRLVAGYKLHFKWEGGEYIDISFAGTQYAFDCINTFDGEGNAIQFSHENFLQHVDEYMNAKTVDEHAHDLKEYSYGADLQAH